MLTSMGDIMREAYRRGWITTRDGNISVRKKGSRFYITPSGVRKTIIHPEHILRAKFQGDELVFDDEDANPSGELEMHRLLQSSHKGCRAVVHLHPTYTIAAMEAGWNLQKLAGMFPEISRYTKVGPSTHIHPVCSDSLATETFDSFTGYSEKVIYDIVGQPRHGVTAMAKTPWDAFEHIERLEHICQIIAASGVRPDEKETWP